VRIASGSEPGERRPNARRDATIARDLRRAKAFHECRGIRRPIGTRRVVNIEARVARERRVLVENRRVEPLRHRDRAADVGGEQQDRVGRLERGAGDVERVAAGVAVIVGCSAWS
jgi:hypothetical protein